jgi:hypothetical protein
LLAAAALLLLAVGGVKAAGPQAEVRIGPSVDCSRVEVTVIYSGMSPGDVVVGNVARNELVIPGMSEGFYSNYLSGSGSTVEWSDLFVPGMTVEVAFAVNPYGPDPLPTDSPPGTFGEPPIITLGDNYRIVSYVAEACTPTPLPTLPPTSASEPPRSDTMPSLLWFVGLALGGLIVGYLTETRRHP